MDKVLNPQGRRVFLSRPRPRTILILALASITAWFLLFSGPGPQLQVRPHPHDDESVETVLPDVPASGSDSASDYFGNVEEPSKPKPKERPVWDIDIEELRNWQDPTDRENYDEVEPGYETDGISRDAGQIGNLQHEKDMRKMWRYVYKMTAK